MSGPVFVPPSRALLEQLAGPVLAELIRYQRAQGSVLDPEALEREARALLDAHAETLASLSIGALFEVFRATDLGRKDPSVYPRIVASLGAEALAAEAEATAGAVEAVAARNRARVALLAAVADASAIAARGALGVALAAALGGLAVGVVGGEAPR